MPHPHRPPHDILVILTDQFNPRMAGFEGCPVDVTPNLNRLAAEGTVFDNAYTPSPVCMPARISLVSGRYPHNHGFWTNQVDLPMPGDIAGVFHDLRAVGYRTAQVGKFHYCSDAWGTDLRDLSDYFSTLGLDHAEELPEPFSGGFYRSAYTDMLAERGLLDEYLQTIARWFADGQYALNDNPLPPECHTDWFTTDRAIDYIEQVPTDDRLALVVSFPGPHTPLDAPGRFARLVDPADVPLEDNVPETVHFGGRTFSQDTIRRMRANYFGRIALIDEMVGRLVDTMQRRGTWDNTLCIVTSDHGDYMGSHGRLSKCGFHDESARVPLVVRWPDRAEAGTRRNDPVGLLDLYPTMVEAAGSGPGIQQFGQSLFDTDDHRPVLSEFGTRDRQYMVRHGRLKYIAAGPREHVFDLVDDPLEMNDQADDPSCRTTLDEMRDALRLELMRTQVNLSQSYRPLFERVGLDSATRSVDQHMLRLFRQWHGLDMQDDDLG